MRLEGRIHWLHLPDKPEIEVDDFGDGSCGVSKVAVQPMGVAKRVPILL